MNFCKEMRKQCAAANEMGHCRLPVYTKCSLKREEELDKRNRKTPLDDEADKDTIEFLAKYIIQKVDADLLRHALKEIKKEMDALDKRIKKLEKRSEP